MRSVIGGLCVGVLLVGAAPAASVGQKTQKDSAFHALQLRGKIVMGVDQYTSTHVFQDLADGGRIELQRDADDAEGTRAIRRHLKSIADAFAAGDFTAPALVHMKDVPGSQVMAAQRKSIVYRFRELRRGGELMIRSSNPAAVAAIHQFLAFQRAEHHNHE